MISPDFFDRSTQTDVITVYSIVLIYWLVLFLIIFRPIIIEKRYNINSTIPINFFYTIGAFLLNVISFFYDSDFVWISNIVRFSQISYSIWYNIIDTCHYKHGESNIVWPFHHTAVVLTGIGCHFIPFVNGASKLICIIELGSFFFAVNGIYRKTNAKISLVCLVFITLSRCYMVYQFIILSSYVASGEGGEGWILVLSVFWLFIVLLGTFVNVWFCYANIRNFLKYFVFKDNSSLKSMDHDIHKLR